MKKIIPFSLLTVVLFACKPAANKAEKATETITLVADSMVGDEKQDSVATIKAQPETNDCVRGAAEPVVLKAVFPKTHFQLQPDGLTGIEIVDLPTGDHLIINNCGCEGYTLMFRFETNRFKQDTTNLEFWFRTTVKLLSEIEKGIDAPVHLQKAIEKLSQLIENGRTTNYQNLKLEEGIEIDEGDISESVSVDRISKLANNKYAVEVTFAIGPL